MKSTKYPKLSQTTGKTRCKTWTRRKWWHHVPFALCLTPRYYGSHQENNIPFYSPINKLSIWHKMCCENLNKNSGRGVNWLWFRLLKVFHMIFVPSAVFINCQSVGGYSTVRFSNMEDAMTRQWTFFFLSGSLGFFHPKGTNTFAKSMKISSWTDSI